jgi:muconolactone D-isomerase
MLYQLDFRVEYPGMTQKDLFIIWTKQADAALKVKDSGVAVDLWKCVGSHRLIAIVDVPTTDALDQILFDLPIMRKVGQHVHVDVTCLKVYEDFTTSARSRF